MKIQVDCVRARRGLEPRYFWLSGQRLHVVEVLERSPGPAHETLRVRIADGREFILAHDAPSGEWELVQVCPPRRAQRSSGQSPSGSSTEASSSRGR